jgi:lipid-A-disaccharide synthase
MMETCRLVLAARLSTRFEVAVASPDHGDRVRTMAGDFPLTIKVNTAHELMKKAGAGIVCSGTATLEAAFFELPYLLIYKAAWLTFELGRRLVDVDCLGIMNILNNYRHNPPDDPRLPARSAPKIVKEFIQYFAKPEAMAAEALRLLDDSSARESLIADFREILSGLKAEGASVRAATALLEEIRRR